MLRKSTPQNWWERQECAVSDPRLLPPSFFQLSKGKPPECCSQEPRAPSPQATSWRRWNALFPREAELQGFALYPQLPTAETNSKQVLLRGAGSLLLPNPPGRTEALPWVWNAENTGVPITLVLAPGSVPGEANQRDLRLLPPLHNHHSATRAGLRSLPLFPPMALEPWLSDLSKLEKQAMTSIAPNLFPRNWDFIFNRAWGSSNLRALSTTLEVLKKGSGEIHGFWEHTA